jgi:plastocyanin
MRLIHTEPVHASGRRSGRIAITLAVTLLVVAACSSGGSSTAPSAPASQAPASQAPAAGGSAVAISGFAYQPAALSVAVGSTVTWTNADSTSHTVTADDDSFKSDTLGKDATFSQTFSTAGTFAYHCAIHPSMKATVTVG